MERFIPFDPNNRTEMELLLPRLVILAGEQTERAGDHTIFSKFDMSVSRFSLLASLARAQRPLSMTEVKNFMVRSPSNLTQMVDHLEQRKLLKRIPQAGDRRVNLLELTPEGYRLLGEIGVDFQNVMREFLKDMTSEDMECAIRLLLDIIQGMLRMQGLEPPRLREAEV